MALPQKLLLPFAVAALFASSVFSTTRTRCYSAGSARRGAHPRTIAGSMLEAALDECRSDLSYVDGTSG
jgi:hypothetical protein